MSIDYLFKSFKITFKLIIQIIYETNVFRVESDEEKLYNLLKNPNDKYAFEIEVEHLKKDLTKPRTMILSNGQKIEIFV